MLCNNISVRDGVLFFAGMSTLELAEKYDTPLYLMDEDRIRHNCRLYKSALHKYFGSQAAPAYASKAACFKRLVGIMAEEGMWLDLVSPGEIYTAFSSGFDMSHSLFHSNNKSDGDISFAMDCSVGFFVADCTEELYAVNAEALRRGIKQKLLMRITPGIDPHTYKAISTGKVDSKFGVSIETGQALSAIEIALSLPGIELSGYHCHIGSQVFKEDVYERTARVMLEFTKDIQGRLGYLPEVLDLGGGFGVPYLVSDPKIDIASKLSGLAEEILSSCERLQIPLPYIIVEPGRSIVADAGMTLYTVGSVKQIPLYKNYVSVDGGMPDNPRFALYGAKYTCLAAGRMNEDCNFLCSLAGRCCESGDIIQENVSFPASIKRGDIVAVCTTGAYNYSMASNYNRVPRPPVVMLKDGESYVAVKRESLSDLCSLDA